MGDLLVGSQLDAKLVKDTVECGLIEIHVLGIGPELDLDDFLVVSSVLAGVE